MAYIVSRSDARFELRESAWTPKGPRSRTLATFSRIGPEVVKQAIERSHGLVTKADLIAAARRAGVHVLRPPADEAATRLLSALDDGERLSPALDRVLRDRLGPALDKAARPVSDAERAATAWLGRSLADRGDALRDLLLLSDRLPERRRAERSGFPVIRTTSP